MKINYLLIVWLLPEDIVKTYENEGFLCIEDPTRAVVAMSALMFFGEKFNEKNVINNFNKNDFSVQIPNKKLNEFDCSKILRNARITNSFIFFNTQRRGIVIYLQKR